MGFTKLDEGILQSSIAGEEGDTFKIFILLLAACKSDGIAPVSPVFLSSISKISIDETMRHLSKLESPDIYSRSTENEGRRIRRVDGGFEIINYQKYREFSYSDNPESVRKRNYRDKLGHVPKCPGHSASVSSSLNSSELIHKTDPSQESEGNTETWRSSFPIYLAEQQAVYNDLLEDAEWLKTHARLNGGIDPVLTMEKAYRNFWGTEEGWRHKRKDRKREKINWRLTYQNALTIKSNRVYPEKKDVL
jgi:hypothetical protein